MPPAASEATFSSRVGGAHASPVTAGSGRKEGKEGAAVVGFLYVGSEASNFQESFSGSSCSLIAARLPPFPPLESRKWKWMEAPRLPRSWQASARRRRSN